MLGGGVTFGPKREEVLRGWGKLHIKELHTLYSSLDNIWKTERR